MFHYLNFSRVLYKDIRIFIILLIFIMIIFMFHLTENKAVITTIAHLLEATQFCAFRVI